jgi:SAM-dependent methyltransferase
MNRRELEKQAYALFVKTKDHPVSVAVRTAIGASLWPISNQWVTRGLHTLSHYAAKVQTIRYHYLSGSRLQNQPLSPAIYTMAYRDRYSPWFTRGAYNRQVIPPGGSVLTIGCGDGFYDYFFYSTLASSVDAVDIVPSAIARARQLHSAPNITYHLMDAVSSPLPRERYDVIVMDSCIAHFSESALETLLPRLVAAMGDTSMYVGSEVMETHDNRTHDHQLAFPTTEAMRTFLERFFPEVQVWKEEEPRYSRVFFRCAKSEEAFRRLEQQLERSTTTPPASARTASSH